MTEEGGAAFVNRSNPALAPAKPAMEQLRLIRDFLGVTFKVKPDTEKGDKSVLLSCLGSGHVNVAKQVT